MSALTLVKGLIFRIYRELARMPRPFPSDPELRRPVNDSRRIEPALDPEDLQEGQVQRIRFRLPIYKERDKRRDQRERHNSDQERRNGFKAPERIRNAK